MAESRYVYPVVLVLFACVSPLVHAAGADANPFLSGRQVWERKVEWKMTGDKRAAVLFIILTGILVAFGPPALCNEQKKVYLFTSFRGNGEDGLHLAYSHDGYHWTDFEKVFLRPQVGMSKLMRDPCLIQCPDGTFHMVWTAGWWEKGIGYANSRDLITWSNQKYIEVMAHEPQAKNCWAPEVFYDQAKAQFLIFWATTIPGRFPETEKQGDHNHRIYYVATRDFESFSKAKLLYEHGFNVIDSTIVRDGERYVMFLKDETRQPPQKNIRLATATSAEGPYSRPCEPITGQYWAEGPTVIKIDDTWFVYFDKYTKHEYGLVISKDLKNWQDVSDKLEFPKGSRHGTVLQVSSQILERLLNGK